MAIIEKEAALVTKIGADIVNLNFNGAGNTGAGVPTITAYSTDGVVYRGTAPGITALTAGLIVTIIPNKTSASRSAKLNLNSLGEKYIRQALTSSTATAVTPANDNWMAMNKPVTLQYDGSSWKTITARSNITDVYGIDSIKVPVGTVIRFAGDVAPAGFLASDTGAEVSRTTYADLFAVIGTKYGAGDGSTTFNLPEITDDMFLTCIKY